MSIKSLIHAFFLSQSLMEPVSYDPSAVIFEQDARRTYTIHISRASNTSLEDNWFTKREPVPYWKLWAAPFGQTGQEMAAIASVISESGEDIGWVLTGD